MVGVLNAGNFFSGDGMSAEKARTATEMFCGLAANYNFGASRVGDERFRFGDDGNRRKQFENSGDGQREVHEIRVTHGTGDVGGNLVHCAALQRALRHCRPVKPNHDDIGKMLSQGERKRSADQAGAEDRYAAKGNWNVGGRHASSLMQTREIRQAPSLATWASPSASLGASNSTLETSSNLANCESSVFPARSACTVI